MSEEIEQIVYRDALENAVRHKGSAQPGAVIGSVMSTHAELRSEAKTVAAAAGKIVAKVNAMDPETQKAELEKLGGLKEKKKRVEEKGLADLEDVDGEVVLRFAPNPSGPLHIGHARAAILNNEYVKRYGGKLIFRIEDTDPRRVEPSAYQMIEEDLKWLGFNWNEKVIQSDRMETYYQYAEELIKLGQAYMCTCDGGDFKKLKDELKACPCRDNTVEENLKLWKELFTMEEGEAVLRVKTDIKHKNPAIRDWVAMRVVEHEHPRTGTKYRVYPMMNFSVTVDDHLGGVTHVLRGKDHLANSEKQKYLYNHFGWKIPVFIHYGRLKMEDVALSTSKARAGISDGTYTGWDDPRLGTIRAIERRGIKAEALHELMVEIGAKMADATVSWKKIYGLNRQILEDSSDRYFFVKNPVKVDIINLPEEEEGIIKRPLHPNFPERGNRELPFNGKVYLTMEDVNKTGKGGILRLMDAVNLEFKYDVCNCGDRKAAYHSSDLEEARSAGAMIVQWVPSKEAINAEVVMPDATSVSGFIEPAASNLKVDDVVQLERFGFARVDKALNHKIKFYFAHK
ncbi:glutamate--tRNA ligase [Methanobacterium congolense]|jgi:glutamyl-tRNA synthetase|uniref:Glutamate--tRNA ligase n=1 Tax=Methanobacterium congolense TaxID=118062 RepID=A0A1D3L2Q0_9EURY|nr:glutamate--tRNA ligase [Methanobacterium congolense]SCG85891.1 Glutamate-tRNA ligase [Methanobacterium congolense]